MRKSLSERGAYERPSRNSGITSTPSLSINTARCPTCNSPLCLADLQIGMRDEAMPDDPLHALGKRRYPRRINLGNDDNDVALLCGVPAISPDNSEDFRSALFRQVDSPHQIDTDIPLRIAATH